MLIFFRIELTVKANKSQCLTCDVAAEFITFMTYYYIYIAACVPEGHFRALDWIPVTQVRSWTVQVDHSV